MAIPISKFGKRVVLTIKDKNGSVLLSIDDLRIDFDLRVIDGVMRGKVSVWNLEDNTIRIITETNRYIDIDVSLHDGPLVRIAGDLYVNNSHNEIVVPDGITSLFVYTGFKKRYGDNQVSANTSDTGVVGLEEEKGPVKKIEGITLRSYMTHIIKNGTWEGSSAQPWRGNLEFINFPEGLLDSKNLLGLGIIEDDDTLMELLNKYGKNHGFVVSWKPFIEADVGKGDTMLLVYKVNSKNYKLTEFVKRREDTKNPTILLDTNNMKANPKIGLNSIAITSNLNPSIYVGVVLDSSDLLTASPNFPQDTLEVAENILKKKNANNRYQVLKFQHKGSNWTDSWATSAVALNESGGTHTNPDIWWK